MVSKKFKSLNHKVATAVLSVAISFALFAFILSFVVELARSRGKTEVVINQLIDTVENPAAIAAYAKNRQIAQDVINGLLRNDIVHKAQISGDEGFTIELQRDTPPSNGYEITRKLLSPFNSKQTVGQLTVTSEGYYNLQEATHSALLSVINSILLIALTTGIILMMVRSRLTQPLTFVSNTLHAISAGEKHRLEILPKNNDDELGRLIQDINVLLDTLETKFTNEHSLREQIEQIEKQLRSIFESTSAGLFQLDENGKLLTYNPTLTKVLNKHQLTPAQALNSDFAELFFQNPDEAKQMLLEAADSNHLVTRDFSLHEGSVSDKRWIHCLISKIKDADNHDRFEGVVFDITTRVAAEQAIRYEAEYDALTGIQRRSSTESKLKTLLATPAQFPVSVMLLDLDGFKAVNDTHGHDAGDLVLIETAKRLKDNVRGDDIVARLGGDEFLIVLTKCGTKNVETIVAEKIIKAVQLPIRITEEIDVTIGVSIGIATCPMHGSTVNSLFKAADEAMYEVKRRGKNGFAAKGDQGEFNVRIV